MDLIQESFRRLFPEKEFCYQTYLEYNQKLSDFNANVRHNDKKISIHLNLQWKDIDSEIKVGLIQSLLLKVFKKKVHTPNIELYYNFIKNIPILTPKTKTVPDLESSFHRVNGKLFQSQLEKPNLRWGTDSKRKLASYNFHNDTVSVSTVFKEASPEVLDYLMYHELLHKYHQFKHKNGRSFFHTHKFKSDENLYPRKKEIEQEITASIKKHSPKKRSFFSLFGFR